MAILGLVALVTVLACGGGSEPAPEPLRLLPGDSLIDSLRAARFTFDADSTQSASGTSLPPDIAAIADSPFQLRTRSFPAKMWAAAGIPKEPSLREIVDHTEARFWFLKPRIHPHEDAGPPQVLQGGELLADWDGDPGSFPGRHVWWDASTGTLRALSTHRPEGVSLQILTDPASELGIYGRDWSVPPDPPEFIVPILYGELASVTRRSLLLPASGHLEYRFEPLTATELRVAVGVADRSWTRVDDRVERSQKGSDGVVFAVEARVGDQVERLWSRHVKRKLVGKRFMEARVDLSSYTGKPVSLRLVTEPGPEGDAYFDFGLWADLRLAGNAKRDPSRPHVVLVDVDTLRADRMSAYGYPRTTTPRIDGWAEQRALRFEDAIATAPWTLPSTVSILTGLAVHQHGVDDPAESLTEQMPTIAARLAAAGYETRGLTGGGFVRSAFGFHLGFDLYDSRWFREPPVDDMLEWIRHRGSERPFFLFVQTYLPHAPYPADDRFTASPDPYQGTLRGRDVTPAEVLIPHNEGALELDEKDRRHINDLYDALVYRADESVGKLLEELEVLLQGESFLVILTSDHGEEFWEHGQMGHGHSMYEEMLRVPLIVRFPGSDDTPAPVGSSDMPVSTLDVVPTILDVVGLPIPASLPGVSLRHELVDDRVRLAQRAVGGWQALIRGSDKLILGQASRPLHSFGPVALFDLDRDPTEQQNLEDAHPQRVEELSRLVQEYRERWPAPENAASGTSAVDEDLKRELQALGYLDGGD